MAEGRRFQRYMGELKRRHVPQTLAVYAVAAWAAIQFADVVVPNLGWPQQVVTAVIIAAAVGLPVVAVLAWIFEWGPDGLHRTESAAGPAETRPGGPMASAGRQGPWVTAISVLVVGIAVGLTVSALMTGDGGDGADGAAADVGGEPMTRSERRRLDAEGGAPRPPAPPVAISPEFADSLQRALSDSVLESLGGIAGAAQRGSLDSVVEMARRIGEAVHAGSGGPVEVYQPENWRYGAPVPVQRGDTLYVEGVVRDSAGVAEIRLDGDVVARPRRPAPEVGFSGRIVAEAAPAFRRITLVARTADGREIRRQFAISQLPRESGG